MKEQDTYYLSQDVRSHGRDRRLYGSMGDPVTVIRDSGRVAIVEGRGGGRFPVLQEYLIKNSNIPHKVSENRNDSAEIPYKVSKIQPTPSTTKPAAKKTAKAKKINPPSLF